MAKDKKESKSKIVEETIELPKDLVVTNHEFLFIYDAQLCNPNGDPSNENKPRMDEEREINLVSDVRLKRYIRDYLQKYKEQNIYVTKLDEGVVTATKRIENLLISQRDIYKSKTKPQDSPTEEVYYDFITLDDLTKNSKKNNTTDVEADNDQDSEESSSINWKKVGKVGKSFIKDKMIDIRLFGATIPLKTGDKTGSSITITGPVQINWGYSLNTVRSENFEIHSQFGSADGKAQGTIGQDPKVIYSFIAFYGNIIAAKCEDARLTNSDIDLFDEAIIKSIPLLSTRSKIGQYPRFYIRIEYNDGEYLNGDLRRLVKLELNEELKNQNKELTLSNIRDISEVELNTQKLQETIDRLKSTKIKRNGNEPEIELVKNIKFWQHDDLKTKEK